MFFLLLIAVGVLAMIGFGSLFGGGVGLGALLLVPIFLFVKVMFFFMLFRFAGRMFRSGGRSPWAWGGPRRRPRPKNEDSGPSSEEKFEDWHRLAHARDEVDSWVPEV